MWESVLKFKVLVNCQISFWGALDLLDSIGPSVYGLISQMFAIIYCAFTYYIHSWLILGITDYFNTSISNAIYRIVLWYTIH
jgi:hypothetical protein